MNSAERQSFTFYLSFEKAISNLDDANQLIVYRAISRYSLFGEEPEVYGLALIAWELIKPILTKSRIKSDCGKKGGLIGAGGAPIGNKNAEKQNQNNSKTIAKQKGDRERDTDRDTIIVVKEKNISLSDRTEKFKSDLVPYVEQYGKEMIFAFFDYWSEPNKTGTKMRFELEKTWDIAGRLRTWERRSNGNR